ncbi:hypothetical protein BACCAP_04289 [Pseudoflavonifractor capillosus ATCC 29799]|uniref:Uncharacterized protein n=1 Tax=Pseudoflavonifractor capillosus ATCC 29799 TaxID=411467 RepID=A6P1C2_9FIRM|nr:hypothetical protein BACCAP_04289 [Pseudoflavonifractor capillosus ATCC 29799]
MQRMNVAKRNDCLQFVHRIPKNKGFSSWHGICINK